ncbi:hypothetical protein BL1202_01202 [Bacillus licheniformis]|nr:hypothetical protein BL1202_01202 [Bacillus licheniformis]
MTVLKLWRKSWSSYNSNIRREKQLLMHREAVFLFF